MGRPGGLGRSAERSQLPPDGEDRCPDADWAGADKTLREGTDAFLAKIEAKDAAGAARPGLCTEFCRSAKRKSRKIRRPSMHG